MPNKFLLFVADVVRYGPLAIVVLATVFSLPSLEQLFARQLSVMSLLERYLAALLIATIGVQIVSQLLITYARRNTTDSDTEGIEPQDAPQTEQI